MTLSSRHPLVLVMESNCKKKISVYANMDVFIHLTTADFLKKKKKKKKESELMSILSIPRTQHSFPLATYSITI